MRGFEIQQVISDVPTSVNSQSSLPCDWLTRQRAVGTLAPDELDGERVEYNI